MGVVLAKLPPILPGPVAMAICLAAGFVFLFREFRMYAIWFCWAYFFVMFWFTFLVLVMIAPLIYPGAYL
ncbi:MAG: hypothetical protein EXQ55_10625 [Acidobacteria bacterium]|nr:hypothetical protein [Acidobacteriota bacterium]